MCGAGRTGKFLGGDHWNCRPDIVALSKGLGSGYAPLGALAAPMRLVEPLLASGGFQHGHTYAGNPLACAAGLAVLGEMDRLDLIANAAAMGDVLMAELKGLQKRFPFIADVRGKGLLTGAEMVADPETLKPIDPASKATQRLLDHAYARGLIIYGRKVKGGVEGDNFMVAPPMIITREQIGEMMAIVGDSLEALAGELDLPVEG
jgi:adenosylmethionine-8-amino-7-oxononanoate aminotransferase